MADQTASETALAELLVQSLNLEDVAADEIEPEEPLFGEGLGLDSIDALELALAIGQEYGVQLKADSDDTRKIFYSLRSLATHIEQHRAA